MIRKALVAALAWCALAGAAEAQQVCTQSVPIASTGAATVKLVADPAAGNARVYVCGYTTVTGAAAGSVQFIGGTGAACATTLTSTLTGVMPAQPGGVISDPSPFFRGMQTQPGAGLCIVVAGTGPVAGVIYYLQQ
jgi:hypothetical protein